MVMELGSASRVVGVGCEYQTLKNEAVESKRDRPVMALQRKEYGETR